MSSDAVAKRIALHAATAAATCPTIAAKKVTPHVLRHTYAMRMLAAGVGGTTIALWLGHESPESTRPYLHADLGLSARSTARPARPGRYKAPDRLLAFRDAL
jgi:integrase/recombinase XerD